MAIRAPELTLPGLTWFNVAEPLTLARLRGRVVLLDFWTSCCINCIHTLPTLAAIERTFAESVMVIGVHTPKFPREHDPACVELAIARYGIGHPVIHDPGRQLWDRYAVRAWPTLVLIGPDGSVQGGGSGEPDQEQLVAAIRKAMSGAAPAGPLEPSAPPPSPPPGKLLFPSCIRPMTRDGRRGWVVVDSGHHQIALFDEAGNETGRIGSGKPGFADGPATAASFNRPQGVGVSGNTLFVADTGNHALRRIDLRSGGVTTICGTGRRGTVLGRAQRGDDVALASPWDVAVDGSLLYFANAGTHQIGVFDLMDGSVECLAGDGAEALGDGPAAAAHLAQPSGLAFDDITRRLYFADSESSAVRLLALEDGPLVETVAGQGLFDFGNDNGPLAAATFQHPLGIAVDRNGHLVVADTFNNALRTIDPVRGKAGEFDSNFSCADPVCLPLCEPAGVWCGADAVLVCDSGNHRILRFDLAAKTYRTWA